MIFKRKTYFLLLSFCFINLNLHLTKPFIINTQHVNCSLRNYFNPHPRRYYLRKIIWTDRQIKIQNIQILKINNKKVFNFVLKCFAFWWVISVIFLETWQTITSDLFEQFTLKYIFNMPVSIRRCCSSLQPTNKSTILMDMS